MDRIETLKLEDRKFSTVPHPLLDMVPVGVATDSLEVVEYVLVHKDTLAGLKLSSDGESIVKSDGSGIKNQCTAWGSVVDSSQVVTIKSEFNVDKVVKNTATNYRVTFKEPMITRGYAIVFGNEDKHSTLVIKTKRETYFDVETSIFSNFTFDFAIYGGMTFDGRLYPSIHLYPSTSLFPERI